MDSSESPKESTREQLGSFFKLPVEVRLLIWEALFATIRSTLKNPTLPSPNPLSILSCSRYLYKEISSHLYRGIRHCIQINSQYFQGHYMTAKVFSKWVNRTWVLKDSTAMRAYHLNFPHTKTESGTLAIAIRHGPSRDLGRLINLWLKVNDLADTILADQSGNFKIHVGLIGDWLPQGQSRGFNWESTNTAYYDYDIAIMPLAKISGCKFVLPKKLCYAISGEPDDRPHSMTYRLYQNFLNQTMVKNWLLEARICLDILLDRELGETCRLLRRDRYMNWFSADGSSAYEQQFLQDLETNHEIVRRYDPNLCIFDQRRTHLLGIYTRVELKKAKARNYAGFCGSRKSCSRIDWGLECPGGTAPQFFSESLGHCCLRGLNFQEIQTKPPYREFSEDLDWWTFNAEDLFSETEFPCKFFNCSLCIDTGISCRWCKKYDYRKRCGFCREGSRVPTGYLSRINTWHSENLLPYRTESSKPGFSLWQDYQHAVLALMTSEDPEMQELN